MSCSQPADKQFTRLSESSTGIKFQNKLIENNPDFNIVIYPYFYNGAGVAAGDINNDGLTDLVFAGNMVKNRLYLNKGNMKFEDITQQSHIADKQGWCTGVTLVDINNDGWLDIYICRSGLSNKDFRKNLLFINNHDLTFTESAAQYGLDDPGYSTQASFFDYDRDGDLDMFLINQSDPAYSKGKIEFVQLRNQRGDSTLENKLYRNDNGHFTNVTTSAGIRSDVLTFSLGLSTADIDQDGWPDIYVANDFKEPDYLYINNHDGTFTESLAKKIDHSSLYSMGCDVADYNNDQLPDLIVLDMLPEGNAEQKMHMGGDNFNEYNYLFNNGMLYQYMKNSLQKNNGDGTFSEIGQQAGISNTDWSWSPLLADFDNDGKKDLFVSNGYKRDNTNIQFIVYSMDQSIRLQQGGAAADVNEYISHMPGINIPNYIFRNTGNDHFENKINEWGFNENTLSHGAVYADLDNDGDLDLITNDIDGYAGIYRNNEELNKANHYLRVKLQGNEKNSYGIGSKLLLYTGGESIYLEQNPTRGFQSSVDLILHAGLGKFSKLDSVRIYWPDGKSQVLQNVKADQLLVLIQADANEVKEYTKPSKPHFFTPEPSQSFYTHQENFENDFTKQFLLPQFYSNVGPCMAKADVNGDKREDLFIGGAKGHPGGIFLQQADGRFTLSRQPEIADIKLEDHNATFFDADGDGDMDLYVVSGGYEMTPGSTEFQDRLFLNDGKGNFIKSINNIPALLTSKSCVVPGDLDGDGDIDLFIGGTIQPGNWPYFDKSYLLINDGKGHFSVNTDATGKLLENLGMVKDAAWVDVNGDKQKDLVVIGEWMPFKVFLNKHGVLTDAGDKFVSSPNNGWYNTITLADTDGDGDEDIILGNYGKNSQLIASKDQPMQLYATDIDKNGSVDPIITCYVGKGTYPLVVMEDLNSQAPMLKKKFYDYKTYSTATIADILKPEQLQSIKPLFIDNLETIVLENTGKGLVPHSLPSEAQYSPVYSIIAMDVNHDGKQDLVIAGNQFYNRIRLGRHDANHGILLLGDGHNNFKYAPESGLSIRGEVRSMKMVGVRLIVGINNQPVQVYKVGSGKLDHLNQDIFP